MPIITVIRAGLTEWTLDRRLRGRADPDLSRKGLSIVERWLLPGTEEVAWRCSPLLRARRTAEVMGLDARTDDRLIEQDWGTFTGQRLRDLRKSLGAALAVQEAEGLDYRPGGGETPREVMVRVGNLLEDVKADEAWITHQGVLRALYALATGWDMRTPPADRLRGAHGHSFQVIADRCGNPVVRVNQLNLPIER
ncbi:MAG: histidine phosphatase family protein [Rhodospirillales bacterium]